MFNQQTQYSKLIWVTAFLSLSFFSCSRDKEINNDTPVPQIAAMEKNNSPAALISASENLVIPAEIDIPENLPKGNIRVATFYAEGVQKYKAREKAGSNPVAYEWAFVAPQADLYDISNTIVGIHSAGPVWYLLAYPDSIFAQQFSPARFAPSPDPESIDWLLLMPKEGKTPTGVFAYVSYIQRIATKGGKAPTAPPVSATQTIDVKYKAIYRFTVKIP